MYSARDVAFRRMIAGAMICMIGIVVTACSYSAVAQSGGTYFIATGAIFWGGFQFLRGLFSWLRAL